MSTSADPQPRDELLAMADQIAAEAASFVASVESVAAGTDPSAAVSVLVLALSAILSAGATLGAQEDVATDGPAPEPVIRRAADTGGTGQLRSALAEQFGGIDEYREVVDPYLGDEVATATLSDDLASIAGDLLQGLALHTEGRVIDALAWWQYSYLCSWGPAGSACLRAVQSLIALLRLGAPLGAPREVPPG